MTTEEITAARKELEDCFQLLRSIVLDNINSHAARKSADEVTIDLRIAINDYVAKMYVHAARGRITDEQIAGMLLRADGSWAEVIARSPACEVNPPNRTGPCMYCGGTHEIVPTAVGDMMACPDAPKDRVCMVSGRALAMIKILPTEPGPPVDERFDVGGEG